MLDTRKYMAIVFVLLITIPMVSQPIHALRHHHALHSSCHHDTDNQELVISEDETCPICDFSFSSFSDKTITTAIASSDIYKPETIQIYHHLIARFSGSSFALRAPPSLS